MTTKWRIMIQLDKLHTKPTIRYHNMMLTTTSTTNFTQQPINIHKIRTIPTNLTFHPQKLIRLRILLSHTKTL